MRDKLDQWIDESLKADVIEGPIGSGDPQDYISNLVITGKRWSDDERRFNLDMRDANRDIIRVHYPIPTVVELRHELGAFAKASQLDLRPR